MSLTYIWYIPAIAANDSNVFVGTELHGVYRSTNNGQNWTQISNINWISSLAVNGSNVFADTSDGIYHSTYNGKNWTETLHYCLSYLLIEQIFIQ